MNINSKIKAQPTYVYNKTMFKNIGIVSGVDVEEKPTADAAEAQFSIGNLFSSECAVVRFYGAISGQYPIYKERLSWGRNGVVEGTIEDTVSLYPTDEKIDIEFHLKFLEAGEYDLYIEFYSVNSQVWSKKVTVSIVDDFRNTLEMYKVVKIDEDNFIFSEDLYNILNIKGMAFQLSGNKLSEYAEHPLFISQRQDYADGIGLTHTLVIPLLDKIGLDVHGKIYKMNINGASQLISDYNDDIMVCPDYWLYIIKRPIIDRNWIDTDNIPADVPMLVCIRKIFGEDDNVLKVVNPEAQDIFVDEYRFYPILHKLIPFDNSQPITRDDIIYIKPSIRHSKPITDCHWELHNDTTLTTTWTNLIEVIDYKDGKNMGHKPKLFQGGLSSTIFAPQEPCIMKPGYYSISLHYKEGDVDQKFEIKSAFLLEK